MASFTVHIPPEGNAGDARLVREGGALAFWLAPVFLAWHRLWFALAVYALAALAIAIHATHAGPGPAILLLLLAHWFVWLEAGQFRRAALENKGWREAGVVEAANQAEAELRSDELLTSPTAGSNGSQRFGHCDDGSSVMMRVAIVDYDSGNLHSALKAFERAARESGVNAEIATSKDAAWVAGADRVVLPGVGAYADCRAGLDAVPGMVEALREAVEKKARPFLGICVGAQLMSERGLEKTVTQGLGWIAGDVVRIETGDPALKIPQIGWNTLDVARPHPLLEGIPTGEKGWHAYFVHSYHLAALQPRQLVATTDYGGPVTAMVARDNLAGVQFHPEKSQKLGLKLIANFLAWRP